VFNFLKSKETRQLDAFRKEMLPRIREGNAVLTACVISFIEHIEDARENGHLSENEGALVMELVPARAYLDASLAASQNGRHFEAYDEARQAFVHAVKGVGKTILPLDRADWFHGWMQRVQEVHGGLERLKKGYLGG
jgi:hypothetical protein